MTQLRKADLEAHLNDFARRSFRDEADRDYIAARFAYRAGLLSQALWSSLQAMEKYFKYILMVNRVPKPTDRKDYLGHNIVAARDLIHRATPLQIGFVNPRCELYFQLINNTGANRYLEVSQYSMRDHLHLLDTSVWSIRRFCSVLQYDHPDGSPALALELQKISKAETQPHHQFYLFGGVLENIIASADNEFLRTGLLWQNLEYDDPQNWPAPWEYRSHFTNAPLYLHPEILEEVLKYVFIPKDLAQAYREYAQDIKAGKTPPP